MKQTLFAVILLVALSCTKSETIPDKNVTVKASVISEIKTPGTNQLYWKAGVIFSKSISATGSATVTWYYPAGGPIHGNPSNRYSQTINFTLLGNSNGYYEFTNWQVDFTMQADSVKISSFSSGADYTFTILP